MTEHAPHVPIPLELENERLRGVVFGDPGCLAGDTRIKWQIRMGEGRPISSKTPTLKRLYERFNNIPVRGKGLYQRPQTAVGARFYVPSVTDEGQVVQNEVKAVLDAGTKLLYSVRTASGNEVRGSEDHEFLTPEGLVSVMDLRPGDILLANPKVEGRGRQPRMNRSELFVKYHPRKRYKTIERKYTYCRVFMHHAVLEAAQNMMTLDEYIKALNTWEPDKIDLLWSVPAGLSVHHIDEDPRNNDLTNLMLVTPYEHYEFHKDSIHNRIAYYVGEDIITEIEPVGEEQAYDLVLADPYRNFVANGLVTHNTGKSTFAASFPRPLVIDTDAGLISVALHGVVLEMFEPNGYKDMEDLYLFVKKNSDRYDSIVIDSFTELQRKLLDEIVDDGATRDEAKGKLNSITRFVPEQGEYLANQRQLRRILDAFRRLNKHVILTAGTRLRGMQRTPDCAPGALSAIAYWSSFIGEIVTHAVDAESPLERYLVFEPTAERMAKSRFSGFGRFMRLPAPGEEKTGYDVMLDGLRASYQNNANTEYTEAAPPTNGNLPAVVIE